MANDFGGDEENRSFLEKLEAGYYGFCDSLEDKGIKVYEWFVNPLEDRGIPSFYAFIIILLLLFAGGVAMLLGPPSSNIYSLGVTVSDENGNPLDDAAVTLASGEDYYSILKTAGGTVSFDELKEGEYELSVSKDGFEDYSTTTLVPQEKTVEVSLSKAAGGEGNIPPGGFAGLQPYSSDQINLLDYESNPDGFRKLVLYVFVRDENDQPLNAIASVYDADAQTLLANVSVENGYAIVDNLEAGMRVFANVYADGYAPYSGSSEPVEISSSHPNSITVQLVSVASAAAGEGGAGSNIKRSFVKVVGSDGEAVAGASIRVFKENSVYPEPGEGLSTNSSGFVSIFLNSSGNPNFKAQASKTGFVDSWSSLFKGGDTAQITLLTEQEAENNPSAYSKLTVTVTSGGAAVPGASVTVLDSVTGWRWDSYADSDGKAVFSFLPRNANVGVSASKGVFLASQSTLLDQAEEELAIELQRQKAEVSLSAFNYNGNALIGNPSFKAYKESAVVAECSVVAPNEACSIEVGLGDSYLFEAAAAGFTSSTEEILVDRQEMAHSFGLYALEDIQDIQLSPIRITSVGSDEIPAGFYPGKEYEAKFDVAGKNGDLLGFHFEVPDSKAIITKVNWNAPSATSLGGSTGSCNPQTVSGNNPLTGWVDFAYDANPNGVLQKSIAVRFKILPLGEGVLQDEMTMQYRAFLKRGEQYFRSPLDERLNFAADSTLPSGCNAESEEMTVTLSGIGSTCNDFACIDVFFEQQQDGNTVSAKDGFTAKYIYNVQNNQFVTEPLKLHYKITLVGSLKNYAGKAQLKFRADGSFLDLLDASYPGAQDANGNQPRVIKEYSGLNNQFTIDLDHLKLYSDMGPGYSFEGDVNLKPLNEGKGKTLSLSFSAGPAFTTHSAVYNVEMETQTVSVNDYSIVTMQVKQYGSQTLQSQDAFNAINVKNCEEGSIPTIEGFFSFVAPCKAGFVEAVFTVELKKDASANKFSFTTPLALPSSVLYKPFKLYWGDGSEIPSTLYSSSETGAQSISIGFGPLVAGQLILGKAFLIPRTDGTYEEKISYTTDSLENSISKTVFVSETGGGTPPQPPGGGEGGTPGEAEISLLPQTPGDCGDYPVIKQDLNSQSGVAVQRAEQQEGKTCDTLEMRVSPIFPADAVPLTVSTEAPLLVYEFEKDGSEKCFEVCDRTEDGSVSDSSCSQGFLKLANQGNYVLRYNPEAYGSCNFGVVGNTIKEAKVKLRFAGSITAAQSSFLTIRVSTTEAFDAPSLFIGPIFTPIKGTGDDTDVTYPQLWAITNLKQIGGREIEVYVANPSSPQSALSPKKLVSFIGPGTQTVVFNPENRGSVLVAREKGEIILAGNTLQSKIKPLTEYAVAATSTVNFAGSGQAAALLGENSLAGKLIRGTVGFEQATVKTIMDNAEKKAKQSAFWRSDLEAWCQKTPACFDTAKGSFISPIPDGCCKANYEDWFKTTVTFTTSTEPCATGKFCNNIGYPSASRNYNENTAGQCELPIDPTKHYEGSVSCTPSTQFNPATQVFTDSRCTVLSSDPADFVSQNPDENDNTYWLGKTAALINYGDSYKDSFGASPAACSADYAKGNSQALNTSVYDCMQKNLYCPISFGVDASDNKKKPYCVPPSGTINGLLSSNEGDDVDVANDQIAFAKFSDKGTGTKTDDAWLCEGGRIFAVRDTCVFENCNTYVFANSKNPVKPVLCDASPFCRPDGTQLKETPEGETASLAEGELVKVKRSDSQFGNTPANAQAPFSLFPTAFQRGFTYSIPINTLASTSPSSQVFYNLGLVAPQQCKSGKTGSAYNGQGLFDLQLALVKQASGYSWDSQTLAFSIAQQSYVQVPCEEPLNDGDTQSCQLLFVDSRGSDDACFKSVTQFDFYREKPDSVNWKDSSIPGVSLSEMGYSGRLGEHKGTKTFAITPTGYIVALRDGYKSFQIFDWWKNDGSYGGAFALNWKKKNMLLVAIGAIVVIAGACIAFPVACGQVAPWLSNALAPIVGPLSAALGKVLLLGGLLNSIAPLIALASCGATMAGMAQYYDVWKVQTANVGKDVTVGQGIDEAGNTVVKAAGPDAAGFTNSFKGAQGFCQMVGGLSLALTGAILIGKGLKGDSGCKEAVSTNSKFTVLNGDTWDPQEADARIFGCRGDNWALDDLSTTS